MAVQGGGRNSVWHVCMVVPTLFSFMDTTPFFGPRISAAPSVAIPITFLFQLSLKVSISKSQIAFGVALASGLPKKLTPQNEC